MSERLAYTPTEFADLTGMSLRRVLELIRGGQILALGKGGKGSRYYIPASIAAEWLDACAKKDTLRRRAGEAL